MMEKEASSSGEWVMPFGLVQHMTTLAEAEHEHNLVNILEVRVANQSP